MITATRMLLMVPLVADELEKVKLREATLPFATRGSRLALGIPAGAESLTALGRDLPFGFEPIGQWIAFHAIFAAFLTNEVGPQGDQIGRHCRTI